MFKSLENRGAGEITPTQDTFAYLLDQMSTDELTSAKAEYANEIIKLKEILEGIPEGQNWKGELSLELAEKNLAAVEKKLEPLDTGDIYDHMSPDEKRVDKRITDYRDFKLFQ